MKKMLFSIASLVAMVASAQAQTQTTAVGDFRFGFKGGYNLSNIGGLEQAKGLSNFHLGGFAEVPVSAKFSVQAEVLYSAQGAKVNDHYSDGAYSYHYKDKSHLDYINVPILAKYYVIDKLSIEAGPQFGFLASAKSKGSQSESRDGVVIYDENFNTKIKDQIKSFDFGLAAGVSYLFTDNIFASARYNFGLSEVAKHRDSDAKKLHNNVFQFSVGYRF